MLRFLIGIFALGTSCSVAVAASVEGRLISIDAETRALTIDSGATLSFGDTVAYDHLHVGQLLRIEYTDGTVDITGVEVLEPALSGDQEFEAPSPTANQ